MYGRDLAYIHHAGFAQHARGAAPAILKMLRAAGIRRGTVVDLGCGSGLWLRALVEAGYDAIGVDRSPAMARLARAQAPGARVVCRPIARGALPPCDAVTALGETLGYLPPGRVRGGASMSTLGRLFRKVARALRPGGLFVFDLLVHGPGPPFGYRGWRVGDDWAVRVEVSEDRRRRLVFRARRDDAGRRVPGAHGRPRATL